MEAIMLCRMKLKTENNNGNVAYTAVYGDISCCQC